MPKKSSKLSEAIEKIALEIEADRYYLEYGIDIKNRKVELDDDVDVYTMGWIKRAIKLMVEKDRDKPISIIVSSYGGSVYDGLGLYDLLLEIPCPIHTHCEGYAMSMGLILFLAGDIRTCGESATFMAHSVSSASWGKLHDLKTDTKEAERLNKMLIDILADRTKKNKVYWKKAIEYKDQYYDKSVAKELGILWELEEDIEDDDKIFTNL